MIYVKILLQILAVIVGIFVNRLDYDAKDRRTIKFKQHRLGLWIATFLFLLISIFVLVYDENSKQEEINALKTDLAVLKKQGETAQNLITGGDSFCVPNLVRESDNTFRFMLTHHGQYPLYNIYVRLWDEAVYEGIKIEERARYKEAQNKDMHFSLERLSPNTSATLGIITVSHENNVNLRAQVTMENGGLFVHLRLRRVNGIWRRATRVFQSGNTQFHKDMDVLDDWAEDEYPGSVNHKIDWQKE